MQAFDTIEEALSEYHKSKDLEQEMAAERERRNAELKNHG
jgi:hypothetical protein